MNQPTIQQIVQILKADKRRDIYETGDVSRPRSGSGIFTVSYSMGQRMPHFTRAIAEAVAATGIVSEHEGTGWFRRNAS